VVLVNAGTVNDPGFRFHPIKELAALLPNQERAEQACEQLAHQGVDVAGVQLLLGPDGAESFDVDGTRHGVLARVTRLSQHVGSGENALHLYAEGLRAGEALLTVPCDRNRADQIAGVLATHGAHAIAYFGRTTLEVLSPF
jgi:hypothetical protein